MQRCQFCPPDLSIAVWDKSLDSKLSFWKFLKCFRKFGNKFLKLEHGGDTKKKKRRRRRRRSIARGDGCSPLLLLFFLFILFFHSTWVYLFFFFVLVFIRRLSFLLHSESLEEEEEEEVVEAEEGNLVAPKTFVRVESTKPKNLLRSGWIFWWLFWPSSTSIRSISTEDLNDCTAKPTNPLAILKKKESWTIPGPIDKNGSFEGPIHVNPPGRDRRRRRLQGGFFQEVLRLFQVALNPAASEGDSEPHPHPHRYSIDMSSKK